MIYCTVLYCTLKSYAMSWEENQENSTVHHFLFLFQKNKMLSFFFLLHWVYCTVPGLLRAFSTVLTSASDFLVLVGTARVPVKKWALLKRIQIKMKQLSASVLKFLQARAKVSFFLKWRHIFISKGYMFVHLLRTKINKIITITNLNWNTWKCHLKHMEKSLAVVLSKKISPNNNDNGLF